MGSAPAKRLMLGDVTEAASTKPPGRWWKAAFFIVLFAFEVAREWAVIENATGAQANAPFHLFRAEGYVVANGRWWRTDGGGQLAPSTVTIECRRETGECVEASVVMFGEYVPAPEMDWFDAQFSSDAVTYLNDHPDCVRYMVRLDTKMKQVSAVRERKSIEGNCALAEERVEMRLGDGFTVEAYREDLSKHFLPMLGIVNAVFGR